MTFLRRTAASALFSLLGALVAPAQSLPAPAQVLPVLRRVNDRFLLNWPNPGAPIVHPDRTRPANIWTRATYFEGLMALYEIDPDARYLDYAVRWGEAHEWKPAYGSVTDRNADNQCCGQTYLALYALDPQPERIRGIKTAIDGMVNSPRADDWWWIDALQMAMPVFARLGVLTGDPRYFEKMYALYSHTRYTQGGRGLYNPVEKLWWRDADFDPPYQEPNGASCYWARGNGWVLAGLVRVLDLLPANEPHRAEYLQTFQDMAGALVPLQRADGFWNVSLMDPGNYGGREVSGTAFFTYGMAWGVRHGHLDRETFLPVIARAWRALAETAVRPDGTLGYVQGTGKQPSDSQPVTYHSAPNFDDFGTGAFLLAGTEVHRLAREPAVDGARLAVVIDYTQVDDRTVVLSDGLAYRLDARVRGTGFDATPPPGPNQLVLPGGVGVRPLTFDHLSGELAWSQRAAAPAALAAAYPTGSYTFAAGGSSAAVQLGAGIQDPAAFPPTPIAVADAGTWTGGKLFVNAAQRITFAALGPLPPAEAEASARIAIDGPGYRVRHEVRITGAADQRLETAVEPFALAAGETYLVTVEFDFTKPTRAAAGGFATESTLRKSTSFPLVITPPTFSRERLANVSARGSVGGAATLMAGFTVSAGGAKPVLIRAVGPALQGFGVGNALANPFLRVLNASGTRGWQNDDWQSAAQSMVYNVDGSILLQATYTNVQEAAAAGASVGAFPLVARSRDSALVLVLPPGSYTAAVTASGSSVPGSALVEIYELPLPATELRLTNLSARGEIGFEPATLGFVVSGGLRGVLVRAIGPSLAGFGLAPSAIVADPKLAIFNASGAKVADNDNWELAPDPVAQVAFRRRVGAFALPASSRDAETLVVLPPGSYTVQADSTGAGTGLVLIEVYTEPPGIE